MQTFLSSDTSLANIAENCGDPLDDCLCQPDHLGWPATAGKARGTAIAFVASVLAMNTKTVKG